jgi:hypothetical protein
VLVAPELGAEAEVLAAWVCQLVMLCVLYQVSRVVAVLEL